MYTDIAIWLVFATDYALRLHWSTDRWRFIVRHPFDALVVVVPPLRPLLLIRAALMLAGTLNRVWETRIRMVALVGAGSPLVLLLGGLAFYDAEHGAANSHVQSFDDALWWAAVTVTTVGYGDIYPVTGAGRLVSLVFMFLGIGLISFAIGTATSWVIDQLKTVDEEAVRTDQLVQELSAQIQHLRLEVAALHAALTPPTPAPTPQRQDEALHPARAASADMTKYLESIGIKGISSMDPYSKRPDHLFALVNAVEQLRSTRPLEPATGHSVNSDQVPRVWRLSDRLSETDINNLVTGYLNGTTAQELARQFGISKPASNGYSANAGARRNNAR